MLVTAQLSIMTTDSEGAVGLIAQNEAADEFKRWRKRERDTALKWRVAPPPTAPLPTARHFVNIRNMLCRLNKASFAVLFEPRRRRIIKKKQQQNNGELILRSARQILLLVSGSALSQKEMKKEETQFHWGERLIRPAASHSPLMKLSHLIAVSPSARLKRSPGLRRAVLSKPRQTDRQTEKTATALRHQDKSVLGYLIHKSVAPEETFPQSFRLISNIHLVN